MTNRGTSRELAGTDPVAIRRVGFRSGTDADLTALHAVETPVAAELGSRRMPAASAAYLAYARNLPSHFDDHAWLAERMDGRAVGCGFCWSNTAGDARSMEGDVLVHRDHRRRGIGARLLRRICAVALEEGTSLLTWSTYESVRAGARFSLRFGGRVARVNRTSELHLHQVDWALVSTWAAAGEARALGYELELVDGPFPDHLRADAAAFHRIMQTAPREDLDLGDVLLGPQHVAELDRALVHAGATRWAVLIRDDRGTCVGGTEVTIDPERPTLARQQNTGVEPTHRGRGLAKWAKAAVLERLRVERPEVATIRTDNAFSNAPMLAINDALGFRVISTRTEWQAEVLDVGRALNR